MAYQTGTSTTIEDLLQQLSTFLVANGWVEDFATTGDPGRIGFSKNGIFVAFQYTESVDGGVIAVYQNLSNDDPVNVWASTGNSGNGVATTTRSLFDTARHVGLIAGPHAAYHFFEQDSNPAYCHIVLEPDTNRFRHFGFGELEKIGDWGGGEYCYGHQWSQAASQLDNPRDQQHNVLLDGNGSSTLFRATLHMEDQPEGVGVVWGVVGRKGPFPASGLDSAGNDRSNLMGGSRGGPIACQMSQFRVSQLTAFKPLIPMAVFVGNTRPAPDVLRLLGTHPDVRLINIANLDPGETFVIAGETWFAFPWVRKQFLQNNTEESWNGGFAYRQELA